MNILHEENIGAYISNIQHFCVHDGDGFRTTIFFQGCMLRCKWCQNPETQSNHPVMIYQEDFCTKCMKCLEACPVKALSYQEGKFHYDSARCSYCFSCEKECYFEARKFSGHCMTLNDVYKECMSDIHFYTKGGGVTFSGGEPLLQKDFIIALSKKLKKHDINLAVETAGFVPWDSIYELLPYINQFLYDIKLISHQKQIDYLGCNAQQSLQNLTRLAELHSNVIVRIPLIPGLNDTEDEFGKILNFVRELKRIKEIHFLPYHSLGSHKYQMIGRPYDMENISEMNSCRIISCVSQARQEGLDIKVVGMEI